MSNGKTKVCKWQTVTRTGCLEVLGRARRIGGVLREIEKLTKAHSTHSPQGQKFIRIKKVSSKESLSIEDFLSKHS